MVNTSVANTVRQLSADDAAFLLDILHHLEAPIAVNVRQIAVSRNATPNAIHQRVFKIRHRYGINIQGGSKRMRESPKGNRKRHVETLLDSDLPKAKILRRVAAAPLAPKSITQSTASVNSEGSSREGCCSEGPAMVCWEKNVGDSPVWAQQPEPNQMFHVLSATAHPAGEYSNGLNQLDGQEDCGMLHGGHLKALMP